MAISAPEQAPDPAKPGKLGLSPHAKLMKELVHIRKKGLRSPASRLHRQKVLCAVGEACSDGASRFGKVKDVIERAAADTDEVYGPTVVLLLGVSTGTAAMNLDERRALAHATFNQAEAAQSPKGAPVREIKLSTFRTHEEELILEDLATALLRLPRLPGY